MTGPQPSLFDRYGPDQVCDQVVGIAQALALKVGPAGLTIDNVIHAAIHAGLMPDKGNERELSYLGGVMRKAGLVATGRRVRSEMPHKHGNWRSVWVHPDYAKGVAA